MTLPVADKDEHGNMITKTTSHIIVDGPVDKNKIKVDIQPTQVNIKKQAVKIRVVTLGDKDAKKIIPEGEKKTEMVNKIKKIKSMQ